MDNTKTSENSIKKILNGKSVEEQITFYKDYYDTVIQFDDYYYRMFPDWDGVFNTHCKLHDEDTSGKKAFGYNPQMNLWSCWGKCKDRGHGSGRVIYFHYIYNQKYDPGYTIMQAIKDVHKMFTRNPVDRHNREVEDYKKLPYPKIYRSTLTIGMNAGDLEAPVENLQSPTVDFDVVSLFSEGDRSLSCRVLNKFLTKKPKNKSYRENYTL